MAAETTAAMNLSLRKGLVHVKQSIKQTIALLIAITIASFSFAPSTASANETLYVPSYIRYNAFMQDTYQDICKGDRMYLMTLENCADIDWLINIGAMFLEEQLDTDRCIEILANMVTLTNYELEEAIMAQASNDTEQQIKDFALDAIDATAGLVGMDDAFSEVEKAVLRSIPTTIEIAAATLELTIDSIDELETLNQLLGDYSMQYDFLTAVATYADLDEMKEAANMLLCANEEILLTKLDTFANLADATSVFLAEDIFIDKIAEKLLDNPDNFSSESIMFVSGALVSANKLAGQVELAFDLTILLGDGLFGTTNTYSRYNEMKAMRDIRNALLESIDKNAVTVEDDYDKMYHNISLLKILQYIDARGESCCYQYVKDDGKLADKIWPSDDALLEKNYQTTMDILSRRLKQLDSIYTNIEPIVDDTNEPTPKIVTEEARIESLYDSISSKTGRYCQWLAEGDFDNDGAEELYAYVCPEEGNQSEGEIWYFFEQEERRIFWLTDSECKFFLNICNTCPDSMAVAIIKFIEFVDSLVSNI